jgi:plasmid stabilization system protein ParE
MAAFVVCPHAADDLNEIWRYYSEEAGDELADRILLNLAQAFASLSATPG